MTIEERLEALELSDRRKSLLTLALVLNAALILAIVMTLAKPGVASDKQPIDAEMFVRRVHVVDAAGRTRIVIGDVRGVMGVFHVDTRDNPRLITGVNETGKAAVRVYDSEGRLRYECATTDEGDVKSLYYNVDEQGTPVPAYKLP